MQMRFGHGGAEGGHGGLESRLAQRNDVHIPLGHDQPLPLARCCTGRAVVEQHPRLVEQRRLGRVQILGVVVRVHRPPAKGHRPPARIADREHDPIAERVIGPIFLARGFGQPGLQDQIFGHTSGAQMIPQPLPRIGGKADLPPLQRLFGQAAPRQIGARIAACRGAQLKAEKPRRGLDHLDQLRVTVSFLAGLRIARRHLHPSLAREDFDRLHEGDVLCLHDKVKGVALGVAAKAVIKPFLIIHME